MRLSAAVLGKVLGAKQFLQLTREGRPSDIHHIRDRDNLVPVRFHPAARARFVTGVSRRSLLGLSTEAEDSTYTLYRR
jgi:hypothetical protein